MVGLWADLWFYISSFGLLVSGVLFFFLLGQYRSAAAAADRAEAEAKIPEEERLPASVQMLYALPDPPPLPAKSSVPAADSRAIEDTQSIPPDPKDITAPVVPIDPTPSPAVAAPSPRNAPAAPAPPPAPAPAQATLEDVPLASASPAAAYLQGLKKQLDLLQEEVHGLSKRLDEANTRDENMIACLADIAKIVTGLNQGVGGSARPMLTSERDTVKELPYGFEEKLHRGLSEMIEDRFGDSSTASPESTDSVETGAAAAPPPLADIQIEVQPKVSAPIPSIGKRPAFPLPSVEAPAEAPPSKPVETTPKAVESEREDAKPRRGPVWPV
jgi:hypothetical protein